MVINGIHYPTTTIDGLVIVDYPDFPLFDLNHTNKVTEEGRKELHKMLTKFREEYKNNSKQQRI